jgi:LPXTG-motif cell wall-anchored protein
MSVIPARRRRDFARAASAAGLSVALAGSALVVGALLPTASADHEDPEFVAGNVRSCAQIGLKTLLEKQEGDDEGNPPPSASNDFVEATVSDDGRFLDVELIEGANREITAVIVKGGPGAHVYRTAPFHDMSSPLNLGGNIPVISHYEVCGKKKGYPTKPPETTPPTTTPPETEPPTPEPTLGILEPICDNDVPYLEYVVDPEGTDAEDGDVTITWINPDGDDVVYENLPLAGRALWVGAVVDEDGNPLDWPGWTQLDDGTWVEGDEFDWVRPAVDIVVTVNPDFELTVDYPPSSPICDANPPQNGDEPGEPTLPDTGGNAPLALAGGGLLLGGAALMLLGRRSARIKS